jgi:hypothetical protein
MRPLIEAMLQPLPANRPSSMAAVATWSEASEKRVTPSPRAPSGGRWAMIAGAAIVVLSVGGTAYVFRDEFARWFETKPSPGPSVVTPSPTASGLPPLATPAATPQETPSPIVTSRPETPVASPSTVSTATATPQAGPTTPTPAASASTPAHVPTTEELVDAMPPRPPQAIVGLAPAVVGKPYRAQLPAFADPGGKGLRLKTDSPPDGLAFKDLGDGRGEIAGTPTRAGSVSLQIVAVNHNGQTALMTATIVIGDRPPSAEPSSVATFAPTPAPTPTVSAPKPSQPLVVLESATVGDDYSAALPPFNVGANAHGLALHAEPNPPEGLTFVDLGSGLSQISGKPVQAGAFAFDVVGVNGAGLAARMTVKLAIAPARAPTPEATTAALTPTATPVDKASAFISGFDGGACFLIRPLPGGASDRALQGVGLDVAPFQRFDAAFTREVGVEPQLGLRLIAAPECPAIDLIRLGASNGAAPRIELTNYDVGRGKPLAGTISRLAGRRLVLLLVDNDGIAHRLDTKALPGGDSATFNVPLVADAASVGPLQILLAIASSKPLAALDALRSAPLKDIAPRLVGEAPASSASVEAEFFKLVN